MHRLKGPTARLFNSLPYARMKNRACAGSRAYAQTQPSELQQPLQDLEQQLIDSISAVQAYQQDHPHVFNLQKLSRRIKSDLQYVRELSAQPAAQLTQTRLQGVANNLRGFRGEMQALQEAPGVIAVCKKFRAPPVTHVSAAAAAASSGGQQQAATTQPSLGSDSSSSSSSSSDSDSSKGGSEAGGSPRAGAGLSRGIRNATSNASSNSSNGGSVGGSPRSAAAAAAAGGLLIEVDVVADEGLSWIEVKNQELFGVASGHFVGGTRGAKGRGLADQVADMLAVAAHPEHRRRGRSPQVVVFFPSGVDDEVAAALTQLGAKVASGPGSLAAVCGVTCNNVINLDVTTLCALVSEVSWRDPDSEALQAWAARTSHWRECLAAQQQRPLLAELESFLGQDKQLVVSCAGVQQFEILLQQFSGPLERQRWAELLPRLKVYHCSQGVVDHHQQPPPHEQHHSISSSVVRQQACAVCGETLVQLGSIEQAGDDPLRPQLDGTTFPLSQRLQQLERMSLAQQAVFGLGDALHALTLTANGSAVRAAAACGVVLDVHTHRPVWLTGL